MRTDHNVRQFALITQVDNVLPGHTKSTGDLASAQKTVGVHKTRVEANHKKHNAADGADIPASGLDGLDDTQPFPAATDAGGPGQETRALP